VTREGLEVLSGLHRPAQHRVGIGLKHPGHGTDSEALGQCCNGPHQLVRRHLLAVQRGAMDLEEVPLAAQTHQLAPAPAATSASGLACVRL